MKFFKGVKQVQEILKEAISLTTVILYSNLLSDFILCHA